MSSYNQGQYGSSQGGKRRSPLAFRFRKEPQKPVDNALPFTEIPADLKVRRFTLGGLLRSFFNSILMILLIAALIALVAAFAYQLINSPDSLAEASYNLVTTMQNFIRSLTGTG